MGINVSTQICRRFLIFLWLLMTVLIPFAARGQSSALSLRSAVPQRQAEQQAEQEVALSPDRIIDLLRREPGLLLEIKKMLVRKAYEQGRILDPVDLTDDALFGLLREDHNICVLATQEIEDRSYVRAKPTKEQIKRLQETGAQYGATRLTEAQSQSRADAVQKSSISQEDQYWEKHENDNHFGEASEPGFRPSQVPTTPMTPRPTPAPENPQRETEVTRLPQQQNVYNSMGMDSGAELDTWGASRIAPEQLPALFSTGSASSAALMPVDGVATGKGPSGRAQYRMYGSKAQATSPAVDQSALASDADLLEATPELNRQASIGTAERRFPSVEDLNLDRPQIRRRANPYASIPSLYDLYAQVSHRPASLDHFGANIFRNGTGNIDKLPMDLPAGPDYVLGPGDGVSIDIWGGVAQRLQRVVDPAGRLALPEVGTVQVSGRTLGDVQRIVQAALRTQFHEVEADVSLSRIRTVRVYVVGEVESPGPYDISSLSTPLNALYAARGPTSRGSLRHVRLYRGKDLIQEVDAYDLLLHGVHNDLARIQSGDTIQVPSIGAEVTVDGMVMHPAIYELGSEKTLAEALALAGGVLSSGTYRHIEVERVIAHQSHTMLQLDMPEGNDEQAIAKALDDFKVQDGDKIRISPILPYSDRTVYLDGHVFHPGKYAYREGMTVADLIHSYTQLLPEPYQRHAEIIRLDPPTYAPSVFAFNLGDALAGGEQNVTLKPFDTVRVFGRYDFEDPPAVTVTGEVRDPGDHITNGVTHLRDAVYLAGGTTLDAELGDAQVFRRTEGGKLKVISVNLKKALANDPKDNVVVEPKDRIFIQRNLSRADPPTVVIQGEIGKPGKYPLGEDMTAADLVHIAGGVQARRIHRDSRPYPLRCY